MALFKCKVWRRVWEADLAKTVLTDGTIVGAVHTGGKVSMPSWAYFSASTTHRP